ncbi:MAG: MBL fold metallo-hydrolase [Candidatus Margulisiibacteriota bacterium]
MISRISKHAAKPTHQKNAAPMRPGFAKLEKVGTFQEWFEVYRLTPDTYAIYEPYQFQEAICYLALGTSKALLIDTGNGIGNIRDVASTLTGLPISVVLTHEHADHYGGAHLFEHVAVYNFQAALKELRQGVPNASACCSITGNNLWGPLPNGVDPATWSVLPVNPDLLLEEGSIVDLGGRQLEVIHTPGHSASEICLLDNSRRLLFSGDHFYPGPLYLQSATADILSIFVESNNKLVQRVNEYDHVLGGHNEPWIDAAVIPRVSQAMAIVLCGGGAFSEDQGIRRYFFDGFDILLRAASIKSYMVKHLPVSEKKMD